MKNKLYQPTFIGGAAIFILPFVLSVWLFGSTVLSAQTAAPATNKKAALPKPAATVALEKSTVEDDEVVKVETALCQSAGQRDELRRKFYCEFEPNKD